MFQASTPPPAVAPAPPPPPAATRMAPIAQRDRPLTLTKAGRAETALVRHQIFFRTTVRAGVSASVEGQVMAMAVKPCAWAIETYLQREICFFSMTGLTSCTDPVTLTLSAGETGKVDLTADQTCDVQSKPVESAERRIIASLDMLSAGLMEDDYQTAVRPILKASGVTIVDLSPKPVPSRASGSGTR